MPLVVVPSGGRSLRAPRNVSRPRAAEAATAQKKSWAQFFFDNDPYHHLIVIHNGANHYDLMGEGSKLTGFSLQTDKTDFANVHASVKNYLERSAKAGKPWAVACDEPGDASHALRPDKDAGSSQEDGRKNGLWGTMMAGGWVDGPGQVRVRAPLSVASR